VSQHPHTFRYLHAQAGLHCTRDQATCRGQWADYTWVPCARCKREAVHDLFPVGSTLDWKAWMQGAGAVQRDPWKGRKAHHPFTPPKPPPPLPRLTRFVYALRSALGWPPRYEASRRPVTPEGSVSDSWSLRVRREIRVQSEHTLE
jgi:hypothetical protein